MKGSRPVTGSRVIVITSVVDWLEPLDDVICYLLGASSYNTARHEIKRTPWERSILVH